ncbi:MAG: hypothetical protein J7J25_03845 [Candidatus Omnitrophica bacterium]|nr:hypothetical protein [Candidatus Omnitrophota bacterium]
MAQLHKEFTNSQAKELMERYLQKEVKRTYLQEILGIKKDDFVPWLDGTVKTLINSLFNTKERKNPRTLDQKTENNILRD